MEQNSPSQTKELSGADLIWLTLVSEQVDIVFGYPGGAIMPAYDAMPRYPIRHVLCRHEQGASHMADGYARASGRVGVCIATSGPGATNLVTGIANAMLDSIPLVAITGQVASTHIGTDAFQEVDITGITLPITKHNYLVRTAEEIVPTLTEAFHVARSGRPGPVLVDIAKDAQQATCAAAAAEATRQAPGTARAPEPRDLDRAAHMIEQAERPLILCGHGILKANASSLLAQLVDKNDIPVACTLLGLGGFPATHRRNLGMMGMHGEAWVNESIQRADLLIAIGMRFDDRVTGDLRTYATGARKIHVELDPAEINKNVVVELPIQGDAAAVLRELGPRVSARVRQAWNAEIGELRAQGSKNDIQSAPDDGQLHAAHVLQDLYRITEGKAIIVTDVGQHQMWEAQYYKHDHPRRLVTSGGLGTMGFALPAAIGAKLACPDQEVWVVAGDGGFQMTAAELSTCLQEKLKLNIAIINNGYLGMVRQWQEFFFGSRYVATPILSPDFVQLAQAHGLSGLRVESRSELEDRVEKARATEGTVVMDFRVVEQDSVFPMVPSGRSLAQMIRRPATRDATDDSMPQAAE
ncbi:MAG: biosynthetic-type acetolactate synthase large subunit [Proteobacteria bacterium]|nr:biosynthetic-type acetolactate synthase large subunit [Pseudomonadota bacterium]